MAHSYNNFSVLSPNSIASICCGVVVVYNKSITNGSKMESGLYYRSHNCYIISRNHLAHRRVTFRHRKKASSSELRDRYCCQSRTQKNPDPITHWLDPPTKNAHDNHSSVHWSL